MTVTVFTKPHCPQCDATKRQLTKLGVPFETVDLTQNPSTLEQLQAAGFPFLALGRSHLPQPYAWFDFDNYAGTWQATRWLIEKGHQRIALLGESNNQAFITQRRQGYLDALREAGLSSEWLRAMPPSRRVGYATTKELLALPQPPTAIITDCNTHGDGAAMALAQQGRLTGDNRVALVVYDGLPQDSIIETRSAR